VWGLGRGALPSIVKFKNTRISTKTNTFHAREWYCTCVNKTIFARQWRHWLRDNNHPVSVLPIGASFVQESRSVQSEVNWTDLEFANWSSEHMLSNEAVHSWRTELNRTAPSWPSYTTRYWSVVTRISVTKLIGSSVRTAVQFSSVRLLWTLLKADWRERGLRDCLWMQVDERTSAGSSRWWRDDWEAQDELTATRTTKPGRRRSECQTVDESAETGLNMTNYVDDVDVDVSFYIS